MTDVFPKAPRGLRAPGRRLWAQVLADWEIRSEELPLLAAYCRFEDEEDLMNRALEKAPVQVAGAKGVMVPNPLFGAVRAHRLAKAKLKRELGLEDEGARDAQARSMLGRRLAAVRWGGA